MNLAISSGARRSRIDSLAARLGLDRYELGVLLVLAGTSLAILIPLATRGRPLSGSDGLFPADQLQYFAWIRDSAHHVLIGNMFDLAPGDRPFFHPGFFLSAMAHDVLGISIPLSYQLWKPVAVGLTFAGTLLYVRRLLPPGGQRLTALIIGLFAVMPASAFVTWTHWGGKGRQYIFDFISGEMWSGQYLWGYLMTAIAVFLLPLVLLGIESRRRLILLCLGAFLIAYLQPWQGAELCAIIAGVQAWRWLATRERPPVRYLAIIAAAVVPLAYYAILSAADESWKLAAKANAAGAQPSWNWPWWAMVLTLLPLAAPAALAYRLPARSWQEQAVRIWPFAALAVYLQPVGTFPYHSFQGLTIPLAILAVQGVASVWAKPRPALVALALAFLILPGFAHKIQVAANNVHLGADPYFIFPGEQHALKYLAHDPRAGGVLAPAYSGFFIPYTTGRETYVGAISWSPDFEKRRALSDSVFEGRITGEPARQFVLSTHARFLFADCRKLHDLSGELAGLLEQVKHFGCATVYVMKLRPGMVEAAGKPDAS